MSQLINAAIKLPGLLAYTRNVAKSYAPRLNGHAVAKRYTTSDFVRTKIGNREIVGHGWNGSPVYCDHLAYPFPAIRFREPNNETCAMRLKERNDWKKLSKEEKKQLYRYSFCQTYAEMKATGNGEWKLHVGIALWVITVAFLTTVSYYSWLYDEPPVSFDEEHQKAQLKRMLNLQVNPITGIASKFDYEKGKWK